jgi:hypothetical protein
MVREVMGTQDVFVELCVSSNVRPRVHLVTSGSAVQQCLGTRLYGHCVCAVER